MDDVDRLVKKDEQSKYKQMLDEQIKMSQYIKQSGTMSGVEKQMNKSTLKDFKNYHKKTNSMLLGAFDQSPLRGNVIPIKPS